MRKALLLVMAMAVAACLPALAWAQVATLEPTDSGAPSAIVIFPVGAKPNPLAAGMAPVAFNHLVHEKWMAKANKDCIVCHHTGDAIACTQCHTVEGTEESKHITLYNAMHRVNIPKRAENTPSSCASCHEKRLLQKRNCAGCHTRLVKNAEVRETDAWCAVCHTITPSMTRAQMQAGIANELSDKANEDLATETAVARKPHGYWSPMLAPYKVTIGALSNVYGPCEFNHRHHVSSLLDRIAKSGLAGAFHTDPATLCVTCHHNSPASATPPGCASCHNPDIKVGQPGKPSLIAAYHLQCMNCHTDMKVARPRNSDCTTCHKLRAAN